jgi:hypothetical protein
MLPDKEIHTILQKFGPQIAKYLQSIGYFDLPDGPYQPVDIMDQVAMRKYLAASKAKNKEVWSILEKWLLPEMVGNGEKFIAVYGLKKQAIPVREIATEYIDKRGGELIKRMTRTDQKKLTAYIWQNSMKNERPLSRQILKEPNLSGIVDNSGVRTRTIIRTERGRAIRSGARSISLDAGAKSRIRHEVGDIRTRKTHFKMMGEEVQMADPYSNGEMYPGETEINCRGWDEFNFSAKVADHPRPSTAALSELYA